MHFGRRRTAGAGDRAGAAGEDAVADHDPFAGLPTALGFQTDGIIACFDAAVNDHHILAAIDIDSIRVGTGHRVDNRHTLDPDPTTVGRVQSPAGGIVDLYIFHAYVSAILQVNHRRRPA